MRNQKRSTRILASPGPAGVSPRNATAKTKVVRSAAQPSSKGYAGSARHSAKGSTTARDTASASGSAPGKIRKPGKTRPGADSIDWRYLTNGSDWQTVIRALFYYMSAYVDRETRDNLARIIDELDRQKPTV
jgi:hypothetical protein